MCLGVPGMIVERRDAGEELATAVVDFSGLRRTVCVALVPDAAPGEFVIVHAGIAIQKLDADEAARMIDFAQHLDLELPPPDDEVPGERS